MPILLPPITRRKFVSDSITLSGGALLQSRLLANENSERAALDPHRIALLADTHISDRPDHVVYGTKWPGTPVKDSEHEGVNMADCLTQTVNEVMALKPRPANMIVNGDCAYSSGKVGEYQEFLRLMEPIRAAGITIHVTIGNHDNRNNLWTGLPFLKKEHMRIQTEVIELPLANFVLLDSGRGTIEKEQLNWLAKQLDERVNKPALIFGHYNPWPHEGIRPLSGMRNGLSLLKALEERKHAMAYFHGHTHEWGMRRNGRVHVINQPAVSYYFGKGLPHGWLDMKLTETGANLTLHCMNSSHPEHTGHHSIKWRI